jgi:hypothetical protein
MAPLPGPNQLGGPGSLRSGRIIASFDTTAIGRGLQQLGAGLADAGQSFAAADKERQQEKTLIEGYSADASLKNTRLGVERAFEYDPDYSTFGTRFDAQMKAAREQHAAGISDPKARERFLAQSAIEDAAARDRILTLGLRKERETKQVRLIESLDGYRNLATDPRLDEPTRANARNNIAELITENERTGLFSPEQAYKLRQANIEDAKVTFAKLWVDENKDSVLRPPPATSADPVTAVAARIMGAESGGDPTAENSRSSASGVGQFIDSTWVATVRKHRPDLSGMSDQAIIGMKSDPALGREMTIAHTQDNADILARARLPVTPANLYLAHFAGSDGAVRVLTASDDRSVLSVLGPRAVRDNPQLEGKNIGWLKQWAAEKMGGAAGTAPALDLGPDTQLDAGTFKSRHYTWQDLRNDRWSTSTVSSRAVNALDWVTDQFGSKLKITSGYRAPNHPAESAKARPGQHTHGQAIDIDVSGMSDAEKSRLVALFVQSGARGIGHYPPGSGGAGTIHVDFRAGRGKQPDGLALWYGGQPYANGEAWFKNGIEQGRASRGAGAPGVATLPPNYGELNPSQRYEVDQFIDARRKEQEAADRERRIEARVGLESVITNAPAAIQNTGRYDQPLPTVEQFVDAYGEEGFAKHEEFTAAVETSRDVFDMRTMSKDEIERTVADATPVSTGNDAALETKRYDALSNAASAILKARDADPVGYVMQTVPAVRQAWEGVQPGTDGFAAAVQATTAAQMALGIDPAKIQPLPKEMAGTAATMFGNVELPEGDRIGALTSAVFSTPDPEQRRAIFKQLVAAGVPEHVEGALQAFERGDEGAARRLVQAALIDPSKLPGKVPFKPLEIDESIQNTLLADGAVGDIYYGLSDGTVENFEKAKRDATLLNRAVTLRVMAGEDLATATEAAGKDLFGNVVPLPSDDRANAQILIPADTDPEPVLNMLQAYKRDVAMTLSQVARAEIDRANPAVGTRAVLETTVQNRIEDMMESGYFAERNGGYVFMDPFTGLPVAGMDGAPLVMDKTGYRAVTAPPAMVREQTLQERITGAAEEPTITVTPGRQRADTTGRAAGNMAERSVPVEQPAVAQPPQAPAEPSAPGMPGWQERTMQTLQGGGVPSPSDMTPSVGDVTGEALRRLLGGN